MGIYQIVIYFIFECLMTILGIYYYSKMSSNKTEINLKLISNIIIFSIILLINNLFSPVYLRIVISFLITILIDKILFNDNIKNILYYVTVYYILSLIIELFTSIILMKNFGNITMLNNDMFFKLLYTIIDSIIIFLVVSRNITFRAVNKIKKLINFYFFLIFIVIFIDIIGIMRANDSQNQSLIIISIMTLMFILISIKTIISDKFNINLLKIKNENLKESYKAYSETIDQCKEFKHNLNNDLFALKSSLPKKYQTNFDKILLKYSRKYEWINKIEEIPEGLQGIMYLKVKEAENKKVKIILNTKKTIDTDPDDYLDLSEIIGILIDNAVDASQLAKSKYLTIDISKTKEITNIKIINKFKNSIDVNKIGNKNYSTKEYKSGIGLNYIKKMNNNKIKVTFNIINDIFITNINYKKEK